MADDEQPGPNEQYCSSCGEIIKEDAEICPNCGVRQKSSTGGGSSGGADRTTAAILAILLGTFGAHKFYMDDATLGLLYLCFSWSGIPTIAGLIEGLMYLSKSDEEFQEQYGNQ